MTRENTLGSVAEAVGAMLLIGFGMAALVSHASFGEAIRMFAVNASQIWRWWPALLIVIGLTQVIAHLARHENR